MKRIVLTALAAVMLFITAAANGQPITEQRSSIKHTFDKIALNNFGQSIPTNINDPVVDGVPQILGDDYPSNVWTTAVQAVANSTSGRIRVNNHSGSNHPTLDGQTNETNVGSPHGFGLTFTPTAPITVANSVDGIITMSIRFSIPQDSRKVWVATNGALSNSSASTKVIFENNGKILVQNDTTEMDTQKTYSTDGWHTLNISYDLAQGKYSIKIDDQSIEDDIVIRSETSNITSFAFMMEGSTSKVGLFHFDDFEVTTTQNVTPSSLIAAYALDADGEVCALNAVPLDAIGVRLQFDKEIDTATITHETVILTKCSELYDVPYTVQETGNSTTVTLLFAQPLDIQTDYKIKVTPGVENHHQMPLVAEAIYNLMTLGGAVEVTGATLSKSTNVTYNATLTNKSDETVNVTVILTVVNEDGTMTKLVKKNVVVEARSTTPVSSNIGVTGDDKQVFAYVWGTGLNAFAYEGVLQL